MKQLISPGDLIDRSWDLYRNQFRSFMSISGWLVIIAILDILSVILYPDAWASSPGAVLNTRETIGVYLFTITNFVISPVVGFWVFISIVRASLSAVANRQINIMQSMQESWKLFIPTFIVTILAGLMIILAQIITFGPAGLVFGIGVWTHNTLLIIIGNILVVVLGFVSIYLSSRWILFYFMAPYLCIIDGVVKKQALVQSRLLVQKRFWPVLIRIALPKFVFILFGLGLASILTFLIRIFINGAPDISLAQATHLLTISTSVLSILIAILLNPLLFLSDVILYKNLKGEL